MRLRPLARMALCAGAALSLAVPLRAEDKPARTPTLVLLASQLPGPGAQLDAVRRFKATALHDLKESGVFRLLDPNGAARGGEPAPLSFWRGAGANLAVRFASRSLAQGKLLIESECINLETGAVVLTKRFTGEAAAATRMAHRLVDVVVGWVTGTQGVADSTILCARPAGPGISEIFSMDRDGRNLRPVTAFGSLTGHPAVAPDGRLACVTYKGGPPQIWAQLQPGGPFQRLYPRTGAPGLELSDLAWAPDGGRLAFVQEDRRGLAAIHVLDVRTGQVAQLTPGGRTSRSPSWNPAGTELAFLSDLDGTPQVYLMGADGSRVRRLTADAAPKACVAWNAQGDRIACVARQEGRYDLLTLAPAGAGVQRVASSTEPVGSLCWAPDGRWLLYGLSGRAGSRLRIASLDGKVKDLGDGLANGQDPQWTLNPRVQAPLAQLTPFPGQVPSGRPLVP